MKSLKEFIANQIIQNSQTNTQKHFGKVPGKLYKAGTTNPYHEYLNEHKLVSLPGYTKKQIKESGFVRLIVNDYKIDKNGVKKAYYRLSYRPKIDKYEITDELFNEIVKENNIEYKSSKQKKIEFLAKREAWKAKHPKEEATQIKELEDQQLSILKCKSVEELVSIEQEQIKLEFDYKLTIELTDLKTGEVTEINPERARRILNEYELGIEMNWKIECFYSKNEKKIPLESIELIKEEVVEVKDPKKIIFSELSNLDGVEFKILNCDDEMVPISKEHVLTVRENKKRTQDIFKLEVYLNTLLIREVVEDSRVKYNFGAA